jgi:pimeloyl-ACP methyl ester carboxylesterase
MIDESRGCIDYDEFGTGTTLVLVPGSCSTGAAWRPVIDALNGGFRCVTTSLPGYGATLERRTQQDTTIAHEAEVLEAVVRKAGGPVHLVGHSFGGLIGLSVALRKQVDLASLVILEAPAPEILREARELEHYDSFRRMTDAYFADFESGNVEAIATMIDFYGGAGTFASWPPKVRAYAVKTTPVNIVDWATAYGFPLPAIQLATVKIPVLVVRGQRSHPAAKRVNALLSEFLGKSSLITLDGAAHFMISTHPRVISSLIEQHVKSIEDGLFRVAA